MKQTVPQETLIETIATETILLKKILVELSKLKLQISIAPLVGHEARFNFPKKTMRNPQVINKLFATYLNDKAETLNKLENLKKLIPIDKRPLCDFKELQLFTTQEEIIHFLKGLTKEISYGNRGLLLAFTKIVPKYFEAKKRVDEQEQTDCYLKNCIVPHSAYLNFREHYHDCLNTYMECEYQLNELINSLNKAYPEYKSWWDIKTIPETITEGELLSQYETLFQLMSHSDRELPTIEEDVVINEIEPDSIERVLSEQSTPIDLDKVSCPKNVFEMHCSFWRKKANEKSTNKNNDLFENMHAIL